MVTCTHVDDDAGYKKSRSASTCEEFRSNRILCFTRIIMQPEVLMH